MITIEEKVWMGNPVLEVLEDGQPLGADRPMVEHFSFGIRKAQLILAFMDTLARFASTGGGEPSLSARVTHTVRGVGECTCEKELGFEVGDRTVDRPYLKLSDPGGTNIGIGQVKARALLDVEDDIRAFVEKHS